MIRKANLEDCTTIYNLICDMENKELCYDMFFKIYQYQLQSEQYDCIVYEQQNTVIAVLNMRIEPQLHHAEYIAEIMEFVVNQSNRNKGIGKKMIQYAFHIAKQNGCSQIEVASNQKRKNAHRFYIKENMHYSHYKFCKIL